MKWKDSVEMADEEEQNREEFFDEEGNAPWTDRKGSTIFERITRMPLLLVLLALAIVALGAALIMLLRGGSADVSRQSISALEERIRHLEEQMDKFEAVDEKVTRIWEQAKSFEKFRDRFDRSEASNSLRMDHMTVSLETVQKQVAELRKNTAPPSVPASAVPVARPAEAAKVRYHEVAPNETFYSIAKMYDLTVEDLLRMNRMQKNDVLKIGQKITVGEAENKN